MKKPAYKKFPYVVLLGLLLVGFGWWALRPKAWDGTRRLTVVLAVPSIVVVSYDPVAESLVVWKLPDDLEINVIGGYGAYQARAIRDLDVQEKYQGYLLRESVAYFLGVGVDGHLTGERSISLPKTIDRGWIKARLQSGLFKSILGRQTTSLSVGDLWRLWRAVGGVRSDRMDVVDLETGNTLEAVTLPDGLVAHRADLQRTDALVQRYMTDERLVNEGLTVMVFNATKKVGLGSTFGRMLTNVGIRVVGVEDDERMREMSAIEVRGLEMQKKGTVRYFEKLLGVRSTVEPLGEKRGDVVVRLGTIYLQKIFGK